MSDDHGAAAAGTETTTETSGGKRKAPSVPPEGYICKVCGVAGHWIQQCSAKKKQRKTKSDTHEYVAGTDPSQEDIKAAKKLQAIKPPNCFCGATSRLKKVKKSRVSESSRANGAYFFFCSKQKDDSTKCKFARPVEEELKPKNTRRCAFFAKNGSCKKGDKCLFSHDVANSQNPDVKGRS